jgi:lipoprotein-anchoring transpeptidase ErfK/SrfK
LKRWRGPDYSVTSSQIAHLRSLKAGQIELMKTYTKRFRTLSALAAPLLIAACGVSGPEMFGNMASVLPLSSVSAETRAMYDTVQDGDIIVPAIPDEYLSQAKARQIVDYRTDQPTGTIIVDPYARQLYHVREDGTAMRYAVAVGAAGYGFSGTAKVAYIRDWPGWTPTQNMLKREPEKFSQFAAGVEGGLENPLGARALYLYRNGKDTYYRIHGTPSPWTIGHQASSGCIRMFNQDVMYLASQVRNGAKVVVLSEQQSGQGTSVDPDIEA